MPSPAPILDFTNPPDHGFRDRSPDKAEDELLERWTKLGDAVIARGAPIEAQINEMNALASSEQEKIKPSVQSASQPFILCVEDNKTYLRLRKAVLQEAGYTVLSATNEDEALKVLSKSPVCLVLSDHMLRGITGTELAKKMKEIKRNVPIIVYSGTVPESLRHVDGFINKDEPVGMFLSLIRNFVKRYWE